MNRFITFISAIALTALAACGPDQVSNDTLETGRAQAKANGEWLLQTYRAENPQYANYAYQVATDSSMTNTCPQGDGWVSGKLINKDNPSQKISMKCSTISAAIGCMPDSEFQTKAYAGDDGHCQNTTKVPYPIPKVGK